MIDLVDAHDSLSTAKPSSFGCILLLSSNLLLSKLLLDKVLLSLGVALFSSISLFSFLMCYLGLLALLLRL